MMGFCFGQTPPGPAKKIQTGPAMGARIPSFSAPDQNGKLEDFQSLKGPSGLVLVFYRSADW